MSHRLLEETLATCMKRMSIAVLRIILKVADMVLQHRCVIFESALLLADLIPFPAFNELQLPPRLGM